MIWKAIGKSVTGTSHIQAGTGCDDAVASEIIPFSDGEEVLLCFVSDGAGSAMRSAVAAEQATHAAIRFVKTRNVSSMPDLHEDWLYELAEAVYDTLQSLAAIDQLSLEEYSCTLLGCIIFPGCAFFLQIGDGAIVKNDGSGFYTPVWWPHNGEYQNTTSFVIDDRNFRHLRVLKIDSSVTEVAMFTDGLQMVALNNAEMNVHQPFFIDMFKSLRMAAQEEHITILHHKLETYLGSQIINNRTDDDKTLFLASRLNNDNHL